MKNTLKFALVGALLAVAAPVASAANCQKASKQVTVAVKAKPSHVLAIVKSRVAANPACACEIVKAAIVATEANKGLVAKIVDAAISGAPKQKSVIVDCAKNIAPDAHAQIDAAANNATGAGKSNGKAGGATGNGEGAFLDALDAMGLDGTGNFSATQIGLPQLNGAAGAFDPAGGSN